MGGRSMIEAAKPLFAFEDRMNKYMDKLYKFHEYGIIWNGDRQKDVTLIIDGETKLIEHKYRYFPDKIWNDILVEIVQNIPSNEKGWIHECQSDILTYIICQGEKLDEHIVYYYDIQFKEFREWLWGWISIKRKLQYITSISGYGVTLNLSVPLDDIPENLIKRYEYDL